MKKLYIYKEKSIQVKPGYFTTGFIPSNDQNVFLIEKSTGSKISEENLAKIESQFEENGLNFIAVDENEIVHSKTANAIWEESKMFSQQVNKNNPGSFYDNIFYYLHLPFEQFGKPFIIRYFNASLIIFFIDNNIDTEEIFQSISFNNLIHDENINDISPKNSENTGENPMKIKDFLDNYYENTADSNQYINSNYISSGHLPNLSRLTIDNLYRIILPDFNNIEIQMGPLPKALYFLFLQYTEGIYLAELYQYKDELMRLYKKVNNQSVDIYEMKRNIDLLVDITDNSIHVNLSRIKKSFLKKIEPRTAEYYYITGSRGQQKKIYLPSELIEINAIH